MGKADRLERLDTRRVELEAEYAAALLAALETAAAGSWGLFDHQNDKAARARWGWWSPACAIGRDRRDGRETLGLEPFALHAEFEASRGPVSSSAPGEPKQARAWPSTPAGQAGLTARRWGAGVMRGGDALARAQMIPTALPARSNMPMIVCTCSAECSAHSEQRSSVMLAGVAGGRARLT